MKRQFSILMAAGLALVQSCGLDEPEIRPDTPPSAPYRVEIGGEIDQQPASKVTGSAPATRWESMS